MPATYLDSSAIVKLVIAEPESTALRRHLRRRRPLVSSALARPRYCVPFSPKETTGWREVERFSPASISSG